MPLHRLDHVNVRTNNLAKMIEWYETVLGLESGSRPDFGFPGAWMYLEGLPIVHLVDVAGEPGAGSESKLKLEHFALSGTDMPAFEAKLTELGVKFRKGFIEEVNTVQYNIWDPDGNHIHVDFKTTEQL